MWYGTYGIPSIWEHSVALEDTRWAYRPVKHLENLPSFYAKRFYISELVARFKRSLIQFASCFRL